jgi:hypothetical protein
MTGYIGFPKTHLFTRIILLLLFTAGTLSFLQKKKTLYILLLTIGLTFASLMPY